jgi:tetratricopeptide (TPR) repeat protein
MFERALEIDPQSVEAQTRLAFSLVGRVLEQMTGSAAADMERAEGLVGQALATSPSSSFAHFAKGQLLRAQGRCQEAIPEYETALALDRNRVGALTDLGWCKFFTGSIEESIPLVEQAIRLDPRNPYNATNYWRIGVVHLVQSRTDEAIVWLEKARSANPRASASSPLSRVGLCPQRRERACRRRTRRSPQAEPRRSFFKPRPLEGRRIFLRIIRILGGAEDPRLIRNHLFRRPAQGRNSGGINDAVLKT